MKIFSPVKTYTGMSASVPFCNGVPIANPEYPPVALT